MVTSQQQLRHARLEDKKEFAKIISEIYNGKKEAAITDISTEIEDILKSETKKSNKTPIPTSVSETTIRDFLDPNKVHSCKLKNAKLIVKAVKSLFNLDIQLQTIEAPDNRIKIIYNLPPITRELIGRKKEMEQLKSFIQDPNTQHIEVSGIGGIGKTAFVLKVAHELIEKESNLFNTIIFTTARQKYQFEDGAMGGQIGVDDSLKDIIYTIISQLKLQVKLGSRLVDKVNDVIKHIEAQKLLLIIDNAEVLKQEERALIRGFISQIPNGNKVVVTSREKNTLFFSSEISKFLDLEQLNKKDSIDLIKKRLTKKIECKKLLNIYDKFGGIPFALQNIIGQINIDAIEVDELINEVIYEDIVKYCFEKSIELTRYRPAIRLLVGLSIFSQKVRAETLFNIFVMERELTANQAKVEMNYLNRLCLIEKYEKGKTFNYKSLSLIREYILNEIEFKELREELEEKRYNYYLNYCKEWGGEDWENQQFDYVKLDKEWNNIKETLSWCLKYEPNDYLNRVFPLWVNVNSFANIFGYLDTRVDQLNNLLIALEQTSSISQSDVEVKNEQKCLILLSLAWIRIIKGGEDDLESAERKLREAKSLVDMHHQNNFSLHTRVLMHYTYYHFRKGEWSDAQNSLDELIDFTEDNGNDILKWEKTRREIYYIYLQAEIIYSQTEKSKTQIENAKEKFNQAFEKANDHSWKRLSTYALKGLALIAIDNKNFDEAEQLLEQGLKDAAEIKDKRQIGLYQASFAKLFRQQGKNQQAIRRARIAILLLKPLGLRETSELERLKESWELES
ncbi:hypothetical protein NIES2101_13065 [Calothrix sp. HK-06]|nr:hypothetical protein NIES2101_13065 [Calothrix sp. HK-06]